MDDYFPRAINCSPVLCGEGKSARTEWRVYFDEPLDFIHWKEIKQWQQSNCEGEWRTDFGITSSHASFLSEHDAILFFVKYC